MSVPKKILDRFLHKHVKAVFLKGLECHDTDKTAFSGRNDILKLAEKKGLLIIKSPKYIGGYTLTEKGVEVATSLMDENEEEQEEIDVLDKDQTTKRKNHAKIMRKIERLEIQIEELRKAAKEIEEEMDS